MRRASAQAGASPATGKGPWQGGMHGSSSYVLRACRQKFRRRLLSVATALLLLFVLASTWYPPFPLRSISRAGVARLCPRRVCVGVWVLPVRSVPPPTVALGRAGAPIAPPRHHGLDGTAVRSEAEGDTPPVPLLYPSASSPSAQRYRPCRPACPLAGPPAVRPAPHTRAPRPTPRPARAAANAAGGSRTW